jgi:hypothetical protein
MTQIKYQGAWAFTWDAMFSKKIKQGSRSVKDYHNAAIRKRYRNQLSRIKQHLKENAILVRPADSSKAAYRTARSKSWTNLKVHLKRRFKPGEYQVAVDIGAMYLDHLRFSFSKIKSDISEIRDHIEESSGIEGIKFTGTKGIWWKKINRGLQKDFENLEKENIRERTLAHLNNIICRLENPDIDLAAYNLGISKVIEHIHSGNPLPKVVDRYIEKVAMYRTIFNKIEQLRIKI